MGLRLFDNPVHLVLLLVVILIVFGAGKLPGVGAALGNSIKEFKKAAVEEDKPKSTAAVETCSKCQALIPAGAQFCPSCGTPSHEQVGAASAASPSAIADAAVCAQCGAKNAALARFCAQCGSALGVHAT